DLRSGRLVMSPPITLAKKLVCAKCCAHLRDFLRTRIRKLKILTRDLAWLALRCLIHQNYLGTERAHHLHALGGVPSRDDSDEGVAFDRADDGETGPHVPAGQLNYGLTTTERSGAFRLLDDPQCRAVLLREPRVQIIKLKENPARKRTGDARQLNEWRVADGLQDK